MLPNKAVDAGILWDGFEGDVGGLVHRCGTTDGYIVDIGDHVLGNLWLKDMGYVVMEDGDCISPTHQWFGEMEHTIWCLKGSVVTRHLSKGSFVIADIQVEHSSTGMACELLSDLFSKRSDT